MQSEEVNMKKNYLSKLPKDVSRLIHLAGDIAAKDNMPAYLVGGIVRDLILGVKNFDLDIVVEGDGIKFAHDFARTLEAKITCHSRFCTATVNLGKAAKVDIATARKETYPAPAHLPQVSPGRLKDDLCRRDFTINAMALGISGIDFAKIIDNFDGLIDLRAKRIRVLHDKSFIDDPTRILRAVRFEQRYGFRIEPRTLSLLKEAVSMKMLEKVQPQRLRDELVLIFKEDEPKKCIRRLNGLTGFTFLNRNLKVRLKTYKLFDSLKRRIKWFKKTYPQRRELDAWLVYFLGLIDSLSLADTRRICRSFGFRKGEEKRITSFKSLDTFFITELSKSGLNPSRIFHLF